MRILCLTPRLPYPPNRGDRLRAFHFIEHLSRERFAKPFGNLYHVAADVDSVFAYIDAYEPVLAPNKWFTEED